jgi:hypothetical protein
MQKKLISKLKSKSGVSLIFVLAVTSLLMAIGVSALLAGAANASFVQKQREHNQLKLLERAIHNNILYSLQHGFGKDLIREIYEISGLRDVPTPLMATATSNMEIDGDTPIPLVFELQMEIANNPIDADDKIRIFLSVPFQYINENVVLVREAIDAMWINGEVIEPRVPKKVTVDIQISVIVSIERDRKLTDSEDIFTASEAIYEYTGGIINDDVDYESGTWRLVKLENINPFEIIYPPEYNGPDA